MSLDRSKLPSWSEFLFLARKQGVQIVESDLALRSPQAALPPVRLLRRPGRPPVIAPPLQLGEIVRENLLGHLCRQLEIDPSPLGIALTDLPPDPWP